MAVISGPRSAPTSCRSLSSTARITPFAETSSEAIAAIQIAGQPRSEALISEPLKAGAIACTAELHLFLFFLNHSYLNWSKCRKC